MTERLPDNLAVLYDAFGKESIDAILGGETHEVEGVEFVCAYSAGSTKDRFYVVKTPALFADYRALCERFAGGRIFELGIAEGGSTALMALLARPRKLIAIDLESQPLDALAEFIEERGLGAAVRPYWGVDQTDRARLHEIVADELGTEPLDLIIDDASHFLDATRSSFDALFPFLRPGGVYLIEDWNAAQMLRDAVAGVLQDPDAPGHEDAVRRMRESLANKDPETAPPPPPLSQLAIELLLARASSGGGIAEVTIGEWWVTVRRGPEPLDPATFRLTDCFTDYFGNLPN